MAKLTRNQFAYLFTKLLEFYEKELGRAGLEVSKIGTQNSILGIGSHLKDLESNRLTLKTMSLSHVIYYTLLKRKYEFESLGFPERRNANKGLLFQAGLLLKAFGAYNRGVEEIKLSDKYRNAYLAFIKCSLEEFEEEPIISFSAPAKLQLFNTLIKTRSNVTGSSNNIEVEESNFDYDIFLASPKLTLGRKIYVYYKNFEENIRTILKEGFTKKVRDTLIKHFFGFLPPNLTMEYDSFEKYIDGLITELEDLGFRVYDSRKGKDLKDVLGVGKAGDQLKKDIKIIEKCRTYVLVACYPRLFTSAWLEAGIALGSKKPCIFVCKDRIDDLLWVLQNDSKDLGIEVIEYRDIFETSLKDRIKSTALRITRTNAFRCESCALEEGLDGYLGDVKCQTCAGKGYVISNQKSVTAKPEKIIGRTV